MAFRATRAVMAYTKKTTGIVGLPVEPNARAILIDLYSTFLEKVKVRPAPGARNTAARRSWRGRPGRRGLPGGGRGAACRKPGRKQSSSGPCCAPQSPASPTPCAPASPR